MKTSRINPSERIGDPVAELSVVAFKKSDATREAKKGMIGTVLERYDDKNPGYLIEPAGTGEVFLFRREEFRLATPKDIARHRSEQAARNGSSDLPEELERPT
jgi:hypothetical protein